MALEQQKSASGFPGDTTCLAQGTFVRSIFISLLLIRPISPGHSVRHHLSLTVKLSRVCVCVRSGLCVCASARLPVFLHWLRVAACHMGVPRTIPSAGHSGMRGEDECFVNTGKYH